MSFIAPSMPRSARPRRRRRSAPCGAAGFWTGGSRSAALVARRAGPCVVGLVPALLRLSSVLSEPPPALGGILAAGRCAALPAQMIAGPDHFCQPNETVELQE